MLTSGRRVQLGLRVILAVVLVALLSGAWSGPSGDASAGQVRVLLVTAHPDDETMFTMGRFRERGWRVSIALVTNGEHGQVVEAIRDPYDPAVDEDVLVEQPPGPSTWVMTPPGGPRIHRVETPVDLARERRAEFLASQGGNGVERVFFLSDPVRADFEDSWDDGVTHWDTDRLMAELEEISSIVRPDVVITLNPDETWAHPQHQGLGRIVRHLYRQGGFDTNGRRPPLYGIREHGWYQQSLAEQAGDEHYDRDARSTVLGRTYAQEWRAATSAYVSQSSHPVWFGARVDAGLLPGYSGLDVIRRLDHLAGPGLDALLADHPPDARAMARLPRAPAVIDVSRAG